MINFDEKIERRNTGCIKWDQPNLSYQCEDMIPMWVADMDFSVAPQIMQALQRRIKHPVFGYMRADDTYKDAFAKHFNENCGHHVSRENIILSTGVVYTMNACVQLFSEKGDKVIIHSPAYPPFRNIVEKNERVVVDSKMIIHNGRFEFDYEDLEKQVDEHCKILMLCNPQNPTGRVLKRDELEKLAEFAQRYQLLIIADEIHADFIYDHKSFIPIASINEYTKNHTITCVSCTKSFNLAALNVSAVFIENEKRYEKLDAYLSLNGLKSINAFGLEAMKAAYEQCEYWLDELCQYLQDNRDFAYDYIKEHMPEIKVIKPEATYLMWLDMSAYGFDNVQDTLAEKAKVYMNAGETFGKQYKDYVRLNFACPRSQLTSALMNMDSYLNHLK